jgi:hypothetical protein
VPLSGIDADPPVLNSIHPPLPCLGPVEPPFDKLAVRSLGSDESQISISGQAVSELRAANQVKPSSGRKLTAIPEARGRPGRYDDPVTAKRLGKTDHGAATEF